MHRDGSEIAGELAVAIMVELAEGAAYGRALAGLAARSAKRGLGWGLLRGPAPRFGSPNAGFVSQPRGLASLS